LKRIFTLLFLSLVFIATSSAQRLTGTWEGDLDGNEYLQVNIVEVGNKLCGYTWDYTYRNKRDYCKAYFSGSYKKEKRSWLINGYSFMENSGEHSLMQLIFREDFEDGKMVLNGYCRVKPSFFSGGGTIYEISLKKVSNQPAMMTQEMKDCVKENEPKKKPIIKQPTVPEKETTVKKDPITPKKKDSVVKPPLVTKPKDTIVKKPTTPIITKVKPKEIIVKPPLVTKPKDTIVKKPTPPPITKVKPKENILPAKTNGRENKEISRIIVTDRKINLNVYDNGTVDGDTVSIFYNGKVILSRQRLSSKPLVVDLSLDENTSLHSIVLFAENLGSIPPNTALIIFTTPNGKRYELFSSATLQQNAELIFEYKPQ
jgi:hypothetical protein